MSVHESQLQSQAMKPLQRQKSAVEAKRIVSYVVVLVWALAILSLVWGTVIVLVSHNSESIAGLPWETTASWTPVMNEGQDEINDVPLAMSPDGNKPQWTTQFSLGLQVVLTILFTCAIQGTQTIGLHSIELLVNMSRDEETWKEAMITPKKRKQGSEATGARLKTNPFKTAATSWQNITLFASKALLHWLLGQSLLTTISIYADFKNYQFDMIYMRIFVYGIVATALAIFTTYQAAYQRKGSLPAAWGHFQTLADLVDDCVKGEESDLW